jgi:protein TonB
VQQRSSIVNIPLLVCFAVSAAVHVGVLYCKGIYAPPQPIVQTGRTVVRLTLLPAIASRAAAQPDPSPEIQETVKQKPTVPPMEIRAVKSMAPAILPEPLANQRPEPDTAMEEMSDAVSSAEQDASLIQDKGVITDAKSAHAVQPAYPRISQRRGEEGTVRLSVMVLASGQASNISVQQSSGYRRLDEAAIEAAKKTAFTPAQRFGQNVDSTIELSFTFRLTDD